MYQLLHVNGASVEIGAASSPARVPLRFFCCVRCLCSGEGPSVIQAIGGSSVLSMLRSSRTRSVTRPRGACLNSPKGRMVSVSVDTYT